MAAAEASARPTRLPQPTLPVSPQIPAAFAAYAPPNCRLDFPLNPPIPTLRVDFHGADGSVISELRTSHGKCYRFVREICQALQGKVKAAVECVRQSGEWVIPPSPSIVAVKQLYKKLIKAGVSAHGHRIRENALQEVAVMAHLTAAPGHRNVMRLLDFLEDDNCIYVVQEFMEGGELFAAVDKRTVDEEKARSWMRQMTLGLHYMHTRGVGHRDVSLENAMLTHRPERDTVKVIDFGLAVRVPPPGTSLPPDGQVGKERYMPPEVYAQLPYDPMRVDAWELGICAFVLLFGVYPYAIASRSRCPYFAAIADGQLGALMDSWGFTQRVSAPACDLVIRMMKTEPSERMSLPEVLAHPWLNVGGGGGAAAAAPAFAAAPAAPAPASTAAAPSAASVAQQAAAALAAAFGGGGRGAQAGGGGAGGAGGGSRGARTHHADADGNSEMT